MDIFFCFNFLPIKNNTSPQKGLFMKNKTSWPASATIVRAPFQIQVLFQKTLENSERLCNVECFQGSKHEPDNNGSRPKNVSNI